MMNRRDFWKNSIATSASLLVASKAAAFSEKAPLSAATPAFIDSYINLFDWPFRKLKYADTGKITAKLSKHSITEAWAGSFEGLLHKNIDAVNARLAEECKKTWPVKLIPIGTVNPNWPDWEEDLRRCHEQYKMPGIRIVPIYQLIDLQSPEFGRLLEMTTRMGMFIQVVGDVEDPRHHHAALKTKDVKFEPLLDAAKSIPGARIQLVHWNRKIPNPLLEKIMNETRITLDISRIEGAGELGRLMEGNSWYGPKNLKISSERFLFGSHAPYFPLESALYKLFESPLSEAQFNLITRGNAENFKRTQ
ncbi:hypothetical protein DYBT9275_05661 [Dyadobacter sp. CECT 9275]|uniref:Amidohydrolase-related domain-containing protein n=1 Tax=Dyadobacter helix TaxID=2822344 RepID=A0A916NNT4_9BACT|nr:amidohydrolase family protein [Dyadobacter sp. CECT 9275]CAG5016905.1 hypothetical protein DYBT9275_05661 [Dyadobacter sp. CECT 9275]